MKFRLSARAVMHAGSTVLARARTRIASLEGAVRKRPELAEDNVCFSLEAAFVDPNTESACYGRFRPISDTAASKSRTLEVLGHFVNHRTMIFTVADVFRMIEPWISLKNLDKVGCTGPQWS